MKEPQRRAATVVDVAREAEVSVATAARVLRKSTYPVTIELRRRVHDAAAKVGYVPNRLAQTLRGSAAVYIGLIVGNMQDPFFGAIAQAVTDEARLQSGLAIVSNMQRDPRLEIELCHRLWEHRVSGLILAGGGFDQESHKDELCKLADRMSQAGVVIVSLAERPLNIPIYTADNAQVGQILAQHVLHNGHRDVAVIFGPRYTRATQSRLHAIRSTLAEAGVQPVEMHTDFSVEGGRDAVDRLIGGVGVLPTVIICGGDTLSVGVIQRLQDRGIGVPEDISVIGVGNTPYRQLSSPELSTVEVNVENCAREAVRYITGRLIGKPTDLRSKWSATLVEGGSMAPPRGTPLHRAIS